MAKKTKNSKFDETQWLEVLAQGDNSAHAEWYPDALQIKKVLTANELKESANVDLSHDKDRLMFTMKKLENEHRRSFLKNPIPWAIAASLVLGLSLTLNTLMHQPEPITPLAMNEPQDIKSLPEMTEALKAPPVEKVAPSKSKIQPERREFAQHPSQNRLMLADKGPPTASSENHPTEESDEASLAVPEPPVAASMPMPMNEAAEGLPVPPQPDCACIRPDPDAPYTVKRIWTEDPIMDALRIQIALEENHIYVLRSSGEDPVNGVYRVILKFELPDEVPSKIKSIFDKYHIEPNGEKRINLEVRSGEN